MKRSQDKIIAKFDEWREWLVGMPEDEVSDRNSITGTVALLVQSMALQDAYNAICSANPSSQLANSLFWRARLYDYLEVQYTRIRKITEENRMSESKNNDVYTLRRLIEDIKSNRSLLTKEHLCIVFNIPPTKEEAQQRLDAELLKTNQKGSSASRETQDMIDALRLHETIDAVCDSRGVFSKKLMRELEKRVLIDKNPNLKAVKDFVDKYLAHSASYESRKESKETLKLNSDAIPKAIKDIFEVYYFFYDFIAQISELSPIPTNWSSFLNNLSEDEKKVAMRKLKKVILWFKNGNGNLSFG